MTLDELKHCDHCGSTATAMRNNERWWIECDGCGLSTPADNFGNPIERWNARVSPEREALLLAFHDAAIQALAYIETPAKDSYQLSRVKGKAITKLRAALTEYEKQKQST